MRRLCIGLIVVLAALAWQAPAAPAAEPATHSVSYTSAFKAWLRAKLVRPEDTACYGLTLDPPAKGRKVAKTLVVFIHGFNSAPERNAEFLAALRKAGLACGSFAYPNDQALADSARLLADELRRVDGRFPGRHVALVTHSMGGLVARACVEDPALDPGNVRQLIMIAPPTHGTLLAYFSKGTDVWEHGLLPGGGSPMRRVRASLADGLAEAVIDMKPGSEFLRELNGRPRNQHVRYTLVLGTGGCMSRRQLSVLCTSTHYAAKCIPFCSEKKKRLDEVLGDMDELVAGKGDGVVAIKRGRLSGIEDTLLLPFSHLGATGSTDHEGVSRLHQVVLSRLTGEE